MGNKPITRVDLLGLGWLDTPTWIDPNGVLHYGTPPSEQPPEKQCTYGALAGLDNNFNGVGMEDLTRQVTAAPFKGFGEACMMFCGAGEARAAAKGLKGLKSAEEAAAGASKIEHCIQAAENASRGFKSFDELKAFLGSPGEGKVWHHIVEQSKIDQFGAKAIHNVDNVIAIPEKVNNNLNALYSSIRPDITGSNLTIREWLSTKSLQQNYDFGRWALQHVSE